MAEILTHHTHNLVSYVTWCAVKKVVGIDYAFQKVSAITLNFLA